MLHFEMMEKLYEETCSNARYCIAGGMYFAATLAVRKGIEGVLKTYCDDIGFETYGADGRELPLESLINELLEQNYISEDECSLLHKIRALGNRGAHYNDEEVTQFQAEDALSYFEEFCKRFSEDCGRRPEEGETGGFRFMHNPDYYSAKRRYFGMWANCYSRQQLLSIPEYVELERRANGGDINAMLDIAIGFVSKHSVYNKLNMICMPAYLFKGEEYSAPDAFDARYYHWVNKAVNEYLYRDHTTEELRRASRYIATAILDSALFSLLIQNHINNYVSSVRWDNAKRCYVPVYSDQYQLANEMFRASEYETTEFIGPLYNLIMIVISDWMSGPEINYYCTPNPDAAIEIIASTHEGISLRTLNYLLYCGAYIINERRKRDKTQKWEMIRVDDCLKYIKELFQQYDPDEVYIAYRPEDLNYGVIDKALISKYASDNPLNRAFFDCAASIDYEPEKTERQREAALKSEMWSKILKVMIMGRFTLGRYAYTETFNALDRVATFLGCTFTYPGSMIIAAFYTYHLTYKLACNFCEQCKANNISTKYTPLRYLLFGAYGIFRLEYEIMRVCPNYKSLFN